MKIGLIALAGAGVLFATRRVTRRYLSRASRAVEPLAFGKRPTRRQS
jgi:hypothetical protein